MVRPGAVAMVVAAALAAGGGLARAQPPRVVVVPVRGDHVDNELRRRVTQALRQGLADSGVEVAPPSAIAPPVTATAVEIARAVGAAMLLRGTVEAEGRSYTFRLEMVDGKSGAVIASREDRCEICTEAEALETANTAASTLKVQAFTRPFAAGGTSTGSSTAPRGRVVVAEALDLPPSLDEFHEKIRAAIEALVREAGLGLASPPPGSAGRCTTRDCLQELALTVGATDVLAVAGSRNEAQGFALALELWNAARDEGAKSQGWCNFCTGPQMVSAAQDLARPLLAHLASQVAATPAVAAPSAPGADLVAPAGVARRSASRSVLSWIGIGIGAAAVAGGGFLIAENGAGTCDKAQGQSQCPNNYPGRGVGFAVAGAGLLAGAAGLWGLLGPDDGPVVTPVSGGPASLPGPGGPPSAPSPSGPATAPGSSGRASPSSPVPDPPAALAPGASSSPAHARLDFGVGPASLSLQGTF